MSGSFPRESRELVEVRRRYHQLCQQYAHILGREFDSCAMPQSIDQYQSCIRSIERAVRMYYETRSVY